MPAKAYINDKWLHLFFEDSFLRVIPMPYNLGSCLTGFLRVDENEIETLFNEVISKILNIKGGKIEEHEEWLKNAIDKINEKSPYLCYYTDTLIGVLLSIAKGKLFDMAPLFSRLPRTNELYERYNQKFDADSEKADEILAPFYNKEYLESRPKQQKILMLRSINNILFIKEAILGDIEEKKAALSEELALLLDNSEPGQGLTNSQRLLCHDAERSAREGKSLFYVNRDFSVRYSMFSNNGKNELKDLGANPHAADNVRANGIEIYELYCVDWVDDLIRLEFMKLIKTDALIKRCGNCGRLFAPSGRIDTLYCGELYADTGKTCAEIGAMKKYKEKTLQSPAHEAFNKAYKRNNSRVRNNKMTKSEFENWLKNAKKMRESCAGGEVGIDEFTKWLGNK